MISEYFTLALRNLQKSKLRSMLTMIGIIVSIGTIFMLISISLGLQTAVKEQFRMLGTDKFFIMPKGSSGAPGAQGAVTLSTKDSDVVEKVNGVKKVAYVLGANAKVEIDDQIRYVMIGAAPLDSIDMFAETNAYKLAEGKFPKEGDLGKVVVGSDYKSDNFLKKPLKVNDKILIQGTEFRVVGILQSQGARDNDRMIVMSIEDFKVIYPSTGDRVDQMLVQVEPGQDVKDVALRAEKRLRSSRDVTEKTQDFTVSTPEELLASFDTVLNIITSFLIGISAISLLVGSIGIANTMFTSVLERTKEIGTMKAVGAKNSDILTLFLIESGFLGTIGGVIGVILGFSISKLIEGIAANALGSSLLRAAAPWYLIVGCLAFSFLIGSFSGLWPAYRASKLNTVEALRYE